MQWTWGSRYAQIQRRRAHRMVLIREFVGLAWMIIITNAVLYGCVYFVFVVGD